MLLDILVAIDGTAASAPALEHAARLAECCNSRLTLITVTPKPASTLPIAGVDPRTIADQLEQVGKRILDNAATTLPENLVVHRIQRSGQPGPEICRELARHPYDLIVLGSRHRGRAKGELLRSVNLYIHHHVHTPLLSIPVDHG